jgi:hypothetical protein
MKLFFCVLTIGFSFYDVLGQDQSHLTRASGEELKKTERVMKDVYTKIIKYYSDDTLFIKNIKTSQFYWSKFYESQIKAMFPDYPKRSHAYGSMASACMTEYATKIIESRIAELEKWLIGNEDGDCSSSMKNHNNLPRFKN